LLRFFLSFFGCSCAGCMGASLSFADRLRFGSDVADDDACGLSERAAFETMCGGGGGRAGLRSPSGDPACEAYPPRDTERSLSYESRWWSRAS
jgi:hypothetical protein